MILPKSLVMQKFLLFLCVFIIGSAYFAEYFLDVKPCILCLSQRYTIFLIAITILVTLMSKPKNYGYKISGLLILLLSIIGIALSVRLIYLEHLVHPSREVCLPGLDYIISNLPWSEIIKTFILGTPNCGSVVHKFLFLSLSEWSLCSFVFFGVLGFIEMIRKPNASI